jgi:hypothetical protein
MDKTGNPSLETPVATSDERLRMVDPMVTASDSAAKPGRTKRRENGKSRDRYCVFVAHNRDSQLCLSIPAEDTTDLENQFG